MYENMVYLYMSIYMLIYPKFKRRCRKMAGKICPKCGQFTFFETVSGRKCTKCGYTMTVPANEGKGGRGQKCSNCGQFTVFNGKCRNCGASYQ